VVTCIPESTDYGKIRRSVIESTHFGKLTVVAGIIMAYGEAGARVMQEIFERIAALARGEEITKLSTATIRARCSSRCR
jgi:hypothetical protein